MAKGGDFEVANGGVRVTVKGLSRTLRALSAAGADAEEMRDLMHSIGMTVVRAASPASPLRQPREHSPRR